MIAILDPLLPLKTELTQKSQHKLYYSSCFETRSRCCFQGQAWNFSSSFIELIPFLSIHSASVCDFERGSCGWYELTLGDGFDWVRGSSLEVPPDYRGQPPPLDHSTNSTEGRETNAHVLYCSNAAICHVQFPSSVIGIERDVMTWSDVFTVSKNVQKWLTKDIIYRLNQCFVPYSVCFCEISTSWRNAFSAVWIIEKKPIYPVPILLTNTASFLKYTIL